MIRKISTGSQSDAGMVWMGRLLTVVQSARQQVRNPLEILVASCRAARGNIAAPSLIPVAARVEIAAAAHP